MSNRFLICGFLAFLAVAVVSARASAVRPRARGPTVDKNATAQRAVLDKYCRVSQRARESREPASRPARPVAAGRPGVDWRESGAEAARRNDAAAWSTATGSAHARRPHHVDGERAGPPLPRTWLRQEFIVSIGRYQYVIRDLIGLKIDPARFLPSNSTHGFDNIAGALTMSPALMEAYLSAAGKISRLAMASNTAPTFVEFNVADDATQNYHVEGLPFGTRGGTLIEHEFPADGEHVFRIVPIFEGNMGQANDPFGQIQGERLAVTIDGQQVKLFDWDKEIKGTAFGRAHASCPREGWSAQVGVTFLASNYAPDNNINNVFLRSTIETGGIPGYLFFPHVGKVRIEGPSNASRASDTPSRQKIFVGPRAGPAESGRRLGPPSGRGLCANNSVDSGAPRLPPADPADVNTLMEFYASGRSSGTFDDGIEKALRRLLADPEFVYRREIAPASVSAGGAYRISDLALASRLSFFIWSSMPDDELLTLRNKDGCASRRPSRSRCAGWSPIPSRRRSPIISLASG